MSLRKGDNRLDPGLPRARPGWSYNLGNRAGRLAPDRKMSHNTGFICPNSSRAEASFLTCPDGQVRHLGVVNTYPTFRGLKFKIKLHEKRM